MGDTSKRRARPSRKGRPQHKPHICTSSCKHTCGEAGGRNQDGSPCKRPGLWGLVGRTEHGRWGLCKTHDPTVKSPSINGFDGLTPRQQRFVIELCGRANGNLTRAAELAGYSGSRAALGVMGSTLFKHPRVRAAIDKRYEELAMPATEVIKRYADLARASVADLIQFQGGEPVLHLTPEILEQYGPLIKEIKLDEETGRVKEVRLHDSLSALRDIAKIRQLFRDETSVNVHLHVESMSDGELRARLKDRQSKVLPLLSAKEAVNGDGRPQP